MTRINVIPPTMLSDKHLGAEYRELPRICALVKHAIARGITVDEARAMAPQAYTLGRGHCLFFYTRLGWLAHRYYHIVMECAARGRRVSYPVLPADGIPSDWFGGWTVTDAAKQLNLERIANRGGLRIGSSV